jgi:hypothetical protein
MKEIPLESVTLGLVKEFCKSGMVGIIDGDKKVLRVEEGVGPWLLYPKAPMFEAGHIVFRYPIVSINIKDITEKVLTCRATTN